MKIILQLWTLIQSLHLQKNNKRETIKAVEIKNCKGLDENKMKNFKKTLYK